MSSSRRTALIAGLWFAGTFVFSIPALFFYDPVLNHADYILGAGADTRTEFGAFLEILTAICNIATAVVLLPILRRVNEAVALGYVALRIVESTIIVIGLISLLSVVTLREDFAGRAATRPRWAWPGRRWSPSTSGRGSSGRSSVRASGMESCWAT